MKISYCWLESSHFWYLQIRVSYFFHYPIDDIHMICRIPKIVIMRLYHISYLDDGLYHIDVYNYYISYEHSLDHWKWEVHLSNVMYWCILYIIYISIYIYICSYIFNCPMTYMYIYAPCNYGRFAPTFAVQNHPVMAGFRASGPRGMGSRPECQWPSGPRAKPG